MSKSDLRHRVAQAIDHAIDIAHAAGIEHGEAELLAQADAAIRVVLEEAVRVLDAKAREADKLAADALGEATRHGFKMRADIFCESASSLLALLPKEENDEQA